MMVTVLLWMLSLSALGGGEHPPDELSGAGPLASARRRLVEDLRVVTEDLLRQSDDAGRHLLVCRDGFSMAVADIQLAAQSAVVRIDVVGDDEGLEGTWYQVHVYLSGSVSQEQVDGLRNAGLEVEAVERGMATVLRFDLDGEVFVTGDRSETGSPQGLLLYRRAVEAFDAAGREGPSEAELPASRSVAARLGPGRATPEAGHTLSWAPLTDVPLTIEITTEAGVEVTTVMGRLYAWWRQHDPEKTDSTVYELEADNLVLWRYLTDTNRAGTDPPSERRQGVAEIYVSGDVHIRQGQRVIRASELYYDLRRQRGLIDDAVMRTFDSARNIPIYIRADRLRQVAADEFEAQGVTLTTSEFHMPQLSATAEKVRVTDRVADDELAYDSGFDAQMDGVRFRYYDATIFGLPSLRSNLQRPDVPLKSAKVGRSRTYGMSIETQWFLSRILGLREPEGTDSTLSLDYYGKRGFGGGVDIAYERQTYFGHLLGYAIADDGTDRLSRSQKSVEFSEDVRGRLKWQHRHFLPFGWQLTAEASYLSDTNFLQQYYRSEFNVGKEQETLLHLKRIEDNWALSLLGKARINDFLDKVEEMPTGQFHWTGQSFLQDRLTFYSNNQISRYRYRYSDEAPSRGSEEFFMYAMTRNEVDMPLAVGRTRIVPFVAGTFGYEDGGGFQSALDDSPVERQEAVWIGEGGVRMSAPPFWRVYPDVQSRFWDLNQLRHVVSPQLTAVAYTHSHRAVEQRDVLNLGIYQRWQTKRGPLGPESQRTVDWLKVNLDFVWVSDSGDASAGPDQILWNQPFIPLANPSGSVLLPQDRRATGVFGPRRDYIGADAALRLTDTTSILGDMHYDMRSGVFGQIDVGFSRLCWPNLSYYVGSRYLRRVVSGRERGSNAVTFAATYVIDPRYTAVFSQQYDFDYGEGTRSDITLIRRYHRMNLAMTLSADESLDEQSFVVSLWPQGVPELAFGLRRYTDLGMSEAY
jgi:hypothetical protein